MGVNDISETSPFDAIEANSAQDALADAGINFQGWRDFIDNEPPQWDWIIPDVIARHMKGDLNAKSKQWKSFFGIQLALSVSTGTTFLNMPISAARRTVYFNLELMPRGAWERGKAISASLGATPDNDFLYVVNLRGKADRLREHTAAVVDKIRQLKIDFIVLDPRYKLMGDGEDENSAAGLRGVLAFRDALAEVAAVLLIGHDPKGDTAGKSMADRGAGSYIGGADYDFSFALSPHEVDGYSVLSTSCRYRKSPPDLTIVFDPDRNVFAADAETPAIVKQTRRGGFGKHTDPKEKAAANKAKYEAFEKAVCKFATENALMSITRFREKMGELTEGQAIGGRDILRRKIDCLIEEGKLAKTAVKERTANGEVKCKKNGGFIVGTPDKINSYNSQFEELPL